MKKFWETKGKRILAFLLALFVFATAIPNTNMVYAEGTTEETTDSTITISGVVKVPTETSGDSGETAAEEGTTESVVYAGANVTMTYTATDATDPAVTTEKTTTAEITDKNGAYTITVTDWKYEVGQTCEITVTPAEADTEAYENGTATYEVQDTSVTAITISDITLAKKSATETPENPTSYTVTVSGGDENGNAVVIKTADAETTDPIQVDANGDFSVVATPVAGYRITSVVVTNDGATWTPDGDANNTEWWNDSAYVDANGKFEYLFSAVDKNYEVAVTFTELDKHAISATVLNNTEFGSVEVLYAADDAVVADPANVCEGSDIKIVATPNAKYEITSISIKKDDGTGNYVDIPESATEGWWATNGTNWTMENGVFTYTISDVDTSYSFSVEYVAIPEYTISASVEGSVGGSAEIKDASDAIQESGSLVLRDEVRKIVATPEAGYEIAGVTIKKDDGTGNFTEYIPDGADSNWWTASGANWTMENGVFTYTISGVETNYEFSVKYAIKEVTVQGTVTYPGKDAVGAYAGATVTISYGEGKSVVVTTDANGTYSKVINDWLIQENDTYSVVVTMKDGDGVKYSQSTSAFTVSAAEASGRQISKNIALELVSYKISWTIAEGGELTLNDDETTYSGTNEITVSYDDSYKLTVSIVDGYEHMHLDSVMLAVGTSEATEQLTDADKTAGNELHEKEIALENGLTSDLVLTVTVTIDQFDLTVNTTGNGAVELNSGESFTDNKLVVDHNASKTLMIKPADGYQVASIKIASGTAEAEDVAYEDVTEYSKGCYSYIVANIKENKTIEVVFEEIPVITYDWENPQFTIERMVDAVSQNTEVFKPVESNPNSFSNQFVIRPNTGDTTKTLCIGDAQAYISSVTITDTTLVNTVYMRDAQFGTEQIIQIPKTITLYIDSANPEFASSMQVEFWMEKDAVKVNIPVQVTDENLDYVVCATQEDLDASNISKDAGIVAAGEIGALVIQDAPLATGELKDVYYLYAVDKAGNCSAAKEVIIYRDDTEPVVSAASINEIDAINKKAYGNFYNDTVTFTLTVNDVVSEATDNLSSDIAYVEVKIDETADEKILVSNMQAGNAEGEYIVNLSYVADDKFTELKELSITVVDKCNNATTYKLKDLNDTFESDLLMLEAGEPTVTITPSVKDGGTADQTEFWYKNDTWEIAYSAADAGTKLAQYNVYVNDVLVIEDDYTETAGNFEGFDAEKLNLSLDKKALDSMVEGSNTLKVEFIDLAGNTGSDTKTICLDNHIPRIASFELEVEETGTVEKIINWLLFGNYSNGDVIITVTADDITDADSSTKNPTSGLDKITLYLDGEAAGEPVAADADGKAVFVVALEDVQNKVEYQRIHAEVNDKVGNASAEYEMTTGNSNLSTSGLMIETIKPTVTAEIVKDADHQWTDKTGVLYTNAEGKFDVAVSDSDAGLHSVAIEINDVSKENVVYTGANKTVDTEEKVSSGEFTVSIGTNATDGLYEMTATVVDNAGNEEVITEKLYYDATAPTVTVFKMEAAGHSDADGAPVTETSYGYYFHEDTTVIVSATDGTDASATGVQKIAWYTKDVNGTESAVKYADANDKGEAEFTVKAEFKGQIYVCVYDQLENHAVDAEGNTVYVSPNGVIIETPEQHEKETHIEFAETKEADYLYKDNDGNDLYNAAELEKVVEEAGITDYLLDVNLDVIDTYSGIRSVEWSVTYPTAKDANVSGKVEINNDGELTITGDTAATWTVPEGVADYNLITKISGNVKITAVSNDIAVKIKMTDRSGNTSELTKKVSIDAVNPVITITFDDVAADPDYPTTYNKQRKATVTVKERHFKAENFNISITNTDGNTASISGWTTEGVAANPDDTLYTATVTFSLDGDYTMKVSGEDMAGNLAEAKSVDEFTIDVTVPTVSVTYANNNALNGNYYAETQTAIVEIKEHNFDAVRVNVAGTEANGGAFPTISNFSSTGDVHTATITFATDGLYRFDLEFTDKAGNKAETFVGTEFYVDMTAPEIEITGVEDMSANNGDVIPRVVLSDANYDTNGVVITLQGANNGAVSLDGSYSTQGSGQVFTFNNFPKEQAKDDIYTLSAILTDKAGNETADEITFSVNRFGSVYVFDDSLKEIAGTYVQEEIDVRLTEVNVDSLEHDTIRVVVDANGTIKDLTEGEDYSVVENGGDGSWYQYDYTIDKSLFAGDGRYIVTLYSEDVAGNINENIDETKEAEISFGIDKTAPVVIPIDIASEEQYDLDVKTATVAVNDNLVLEDVQVYVGDVQTEYTADGENYVFDIPSASERQDITIVAEDAAGNRTNYIISGVLVTTNAFIRWYNNTPLFVGSIVGVAAISGAGIGFIGLRRRRNYKLK